MVKPPKLTDKERMKKMGLIASAIDAGQKLCYACNQFGITASTYQKWRKEFAQQKPAAT